MLNSQGIETKEIAQPMEWRLPFTCAKRHGILITQSSGGGGQGVLYKPGLQPDIFAEVNRLTLGSLPFQQVDSDTFERELAQANQTDMADTMQMVEGLGDELDLASLANSVPETEDLLEQIGR